MFATVLRLEYDPNRSANIALLEYEDGELRYILAPVGLKAGDKVVAGPGSDIKPGNALPLVNIPVGTIIHNIEMHPGNGAQLVRSAGTSAQLMAKEGQDAQIRMPSGEVRVVRTNCMSSPANRGKRAALSSVKLPSPPARFRLSAPSAARAPVLPTRSKTAKRPACASTAAPDCKKGAKNRQWLD